jgi:hypothetical protein
MRVLKPPCARIAALTYGTQKEMIARFSSTISCLKKVKERTIGRTCRIVSDKAPTIAVVSACVSPASTAQNGFSSVAPPIGEWLQLSAPPPGVFLSLQASSK